MMRMSLLTYKYAQALQNEGSVENFAPVVVAAIDRCISKIITKLGETFFSWKIRWFLSSSSSDVYPDVWR